MKITEGRLLQENSRSFCTAIGLLGRDKIAVRNNYLILKVGDGIEDAIKNKEDGSTISNDEKIILLDRYADVLIREDVGAFREISERVVPYLQDEEKKSCSRTLEL